MANWGETTGKAAGGSVGLDTGGSGKGPLGMALSNDYEGMSELGFGPEKSSAWDSNVPHPYVGPNQKTGDEKYASKMRANLARAKWEDYKTRFAPYEDKLVEMAGQGPGEMVGQAADQAGNQFATGLDVAQRQRERYGLSGTPDELTQRQNDLARGLAVTSARNNARDAWEQQRMGLLTGNYGGQ